MDFHGSGADEVNLGQGPQATGSEARTYEMWAYTRAFNGGGIIQGGATGSRGRDFSLRTLSNDRWRAQLWGSGFDFDFDIPGSGSSWHHFALVYTGTQARVYFDGELVATNNAAVNTGEADLRIGRWSGSRFNGMIDEVRVWDKALDAATLKEWSNKNVDSGHPDFANLTAYYPFDEVGSSTVADNTGTQADGAVLGSAWWSRIKADDLYMGWQNTSLRPNVIFEQGDHVSITSTLVSDFPAMIAPVQLDLYENPATGAIIQENAVNHPSEITSSSTVWEAGIWAYVTDSETGEHVDSTLIPADATLSRQLREWYSPDVTYEIGRFITPYGINLDLGPEGFTWTYDVTEYSQLLRDEVDFSAGNQQELIDVKFLFITGTPARELVTITRPWGRHRSHSYRNLDNDVSLAPVDIPLIEGTESYLMRTRFTGHGHNSNDGSYPHCCEWLDNTHYLYVNGSEFSNWHIWREDCDLNPVFPQGGTWNGAREGWCPGDVVPDYDFEISEAVSGSSVNLDYRIDPVPSNNEGMGNGNYNIAMQLFQFGKASHELDAEIYEVLSPVNAQYRSRENPTCTNPKVILRNSGSQPLTSVTINYTVKGGQIHTYAWEGNLAFMEKEEVDLPISSGKFWAGDRTGEFIVTTSNPNGGIDQNTENDLAITQFEYPERLPSGFIVELRTNAYPDENQWTITNADDQVFFEKKDLTANRTYSDEVILRDGCYTLELLDEGYGLSYWAVPQHGDGSFRILSQDGQSVLKTFEPDFGEKIHFAFSVGADYFVSDGNGADIYSFPNPTVTGAFTLVITGIQGVADVSVYDATGKQIQSGQRSVNALGTLDFDLSHLPQGLYIVKVNTGSKIYEQKVVVGE